jgi:hypothetical protein
VRTALGHLRGDERVGATAPNITAVCVAELLTLLAHVGPGDGKHVPRNRVTSWDLPLKGR